MSIDLYGFENTTGKASHVLSWIRRCFQKQKNASSFFWIVKQEMNRIFRVLWEKRWTSLSSKERQTWIRSLPPPFLEDKEAFLDHWFPPSIPKDLPILEDGLGNVVSKKQASRLFLESSPRPQDLHDSSMYDPRKKKIYDAIQMEWISVDQCVQLKGTSEFMTREVFQSYIDRHTSLWRGEKNVGFKSPVEEHIFGNLVSYNYDHKEFFPQKKGTLYWTRVANIKRVPSQTKPETVIPTHYWEGSYHNYVFYLPDTPAGRLVLCVMKDAFKKGNLFAFTKEGRVRHGRIHKKTSLQGVYGFPDDSYLERVSGELNLLGSSPYTYQFSQDPHFETERDPYPDETRFVLSF